ncbi:hypothetical protein SK224_01500 [Microbacterium sp. BG28]|nr:hypothetical protein [Microbacterium sp. BG28]MDY0827793.1 hypothetical protein [Microbacterium sp. BG28]
MFVDADRVDEAPVEVLAIVDVAELGATDGAAVLRLVEQLLLNVLTALADLNFVHDVRDGFHGLCHVAVAEVFLRGDELDAHASEDALRDRRVTGIPEGTRAHVNHDVRHLRVFLDVAQKLSEHRTLADRLRRVAWLQKLLYDGGVDPLRPNQAQLALGCDGVPVGVDVDRSEHLPRSRYAEVQDRLALDAEIELRRSRSVEAEEVLPASE